MIVRTPRRRISPQTRRRCRAIKGFFRRALGSASHPDLLEITSSIAVNVTDINHKITDLEQQLSEVCSRCHVPPREDRQKDSRAVTPTQSQSLNHELPTTELLRKETDIIYTKSKHQFKKVIDTDCTSFSNYENSEINTNTVPNARISNKRLQKTESKFITGRSHIEISANNAKSKSKSPYNSFVSSYSTSSFRSLDNFRDATMYHPVAGYSGHGEEKRTTTKSHKRYNKNKNDYEPVIKNELHEYFYENEARPVKEKKLKQHTTPIDSDFIADIIKRQYKPVKFGRRHSDLSQFSAPECRDYETYRTSGYSIVKDRDLCRCDDRRCKRHTRYSNCSDFRSMHDTRVYDTTNITRLKHHKRRAKREDNSEVYDLVPVKEKSSPKSRRKFVEDSTRPVYYVPPSPRSQRPQLNLQARYSESTCNMNSKEGKEHINLKYALNKDVNDNNPTLYPTLAPEERSGAVETSLDRTHETISTDKTDKTLNEIKDILQSFLSEIKKEASSQNCKSAGNRVSESGTNPPPNEAGVMTSHGHSFNNLCSSYCPTAPPYLPPPLPAFGGSTCCYPVLPMYPMNCNACMQNASTMQHTLPTGTASLTCNNCYGLDNYDSNNLNKCTTANEPITKETDELIKEIYKFVSQSPTFSRKGDSDKHFNRCSHNDITLLTSRSAGGSAQLCGHDAKVGTGRIESVSKSCEAIGGRPPDTSLSTATYSDTVLERLSLGATRSTSETEMSTEVSNKYKPKPSRFSRVLNILGFRRRMTRDVIEEESESEITVDMERKKPPFRQHVTSCMMYGQEYHRPPPVSPHHADCSQNAPYNPDSIHRDPALQHSTYHRRPSAPPYCHSIDGHSTSMHPQLPLCLKEVEVKSIGCQSDRKISFLQKIAHKMQQPSDSSHLQVESRLNGATQTQTMRENPMPFFNWKPKMASNKDLDLTRFGYETQKKLALGDVNMRNAMLKKMFLKKNPFSPRNLIVRTLLGKDKSSFGNPPPMVRPKIFF